MATDTRPAPPCPRSQPVQRVRPQRAVLVRQRAEVQELPPDPPSFCAWGDHSARHGRRDLHLPRHRPAPRCIGHVVGFGAYSHATDVAVSTSFGADLLTTSPFRARALRRLRGPLQRSSDYDISGAGLPASGWAAKVLKVTAVDARTGEFVVFDSAGEAGLVDAVGASCAVPGVWPPVTIGNRRFVDGGVRSVANADLAASYQRVVIVAPVARGIGPIMPGPGGQAAALAAAGARVALVRPDRAVMRAIGRDVLDVSRRAAAATAGRAQAAAEAPRSGQSGRPMAGRPPPSRQARRRQRPPAGARQHASRVSITQRPARPPVTWRRSRGPAPPTPDRSPATPPPARAAPSVPGQERSSGRQGCPYPASTVASSDDDLQTGHATPARIGWQ